MHKILVAATVLLAGCDQETARPDRNSFLQPLAWLANDTLLILRMDVFGDSDVIEHTCDSTGVWTLPLDGGAGVPITSAISCTTIVSGTAFSVSHDGHKLLFTSDSQHGRIFQFDLTTQQSEIVVEDSCLVASGQFGVNWTHHEIAVTRNCMGSDEGSLWLTSMTDGTTRPLAESSISGRIEGMSWNRHGNLLAFDISSADNRTREIFVVNRSGHLIDSLGHGLYPAWSPAKDEIALIVPDAGNISQELHIITVETGERRVVAKSSTMQRDSNGRASMMLGPLVWSPNGNYLAVSDDCGVVVVGAVDRSVKWLGTWLRSSKARCQ